MPVHVYIWPPLPWTCISTHRHAHTEIQRLGYTANIANLPLNCSTLHYPICCLAVLAGHLPAWLCPFLCLSLHLSSSLPVFWHRCSCLCSPEWWGQHRLTHTRLNYHSSPPLGGRINFTLIFNRYCSGCVHCCLLLFLSSPPLTLHQSCQWTFFVFFFRRLIDHSSGISFLATRASHSDTVWRRKRFVGSDWGERRTPRLLGETVFFS